jgi:hypothetical protein
MIGWIRVALVGLALCGFGTAAHAQAQPTPAAIAVALEVVEIKGVTNIFDPALTGMILRARGALLQANPALGGELDAAAQQVRTELLPRVEDLKKETAKIFASFFTEQELKDLLAFYKSPLGTKLLAAEPKALGETMKYADRWAASLGEEVLVKMRAEMRKRGHDL